MSELTAQLMGRPYSRRRAKKWRPVFGAIADRLQRFYGVPTLGNLEDPIEEVFYIMLSARTTDSQYRRTHAGLRERFPSLEALAEADVQDIALCISGGGLANKRALHAKKIAVALMGLGDRPADRLRAMTSAEVYDYLTRLPGMGPKSALCVMMYSMGWDVFPVDVNVQRVAARLGAISLRQKHYVAQQRLPPLVPDRKSKALHIGLVVLGREVCQPRSPRCKVCPLFDLCRMGRQHGAAATAMPSDLHAREVPGGPSVATA